jgi:hypothetical protein
VILTNLYLANAKNTMQEDLHIFVLNIQIYDTIFNR